MISESDIQKMNSPEQLREAAYDHNWDDGLSVPMAIASHAKCDLGVALELFWLGAAISWLTGEITANDYNTEWCDFSKYMVDTIAEGRYRPGSCGFETPLTQTQIYKYRKQGIPDIYLLSVEAVND